MVRVTTSPDAVVKQTILKGTHWHGTAYVVVVAYLKVKRKREAGSSVSIWKYDGDKDDFVKLQTLATGSEDQPSSVDFMSTENDLYLYVKSGSKLVQIWSTSFEVIESRIHLKP